jgi:6-phosphogluconolactonase
MAFIRTGLGLGLTLWILAATAAPPAKGTFYAYVGTYTDRNSSSKGIYVYRFNTASGALDSIGLAAESPNPTFLAISPNHKYLYAANEIGKFNGEKAGSISAFRIEPATGKLAALNVVSSRGPGPCHLTVDRTGKYVLVANYSGGSVAVLAIKADGSLGEATSFDQHTGSSVNKSRQSEPHAHSIYMSPDNRFAITCDLGLDKVMVYKFDASKGVLTPNNPPATKIEPGAGPRHFAFHPNGKYGYSINEMQSGVDVFDWDGRRGVLTEKQNISTLPSGFKGENTDAEVFVHPNGKFLYGSNRGDDSIAVFSIASDGKLTPVEVTKAQVVMPRNFAIDPTGNWLITEGQKSDNIVVFHLDPKTGRLTPAGTSVQLHAPVCIEWVPAP